jgi:hypothetical protein
LVVGRDGALRRAFRVVAVVFGETAGNWEFGELGRGLDVFWEAVEESG